VDGNVILGPTADDVIEDETDTTILGIVDVKEKATTMTPKVNLSEIITSFAGARAYCDRHDFIIEESKTVSGLINCAGIESPGLTSAPAIAKFVVEELVSKRIKLVKNKSFNPFRTPDDFFSKMSVNEKNAYIKQNPDYGKIVCRCENITKGEISRVLHLNPPTSSVDGIKRRVRVGMGRCQGGFCQPQVLDIIAEEFGVDRLSVTKNGKNSFILKERTK